jgi:hypothetical protein
MKPLIATSLILSAFGTFEAWAACPHTTGTNAPLNTNQVKSALGTANTYHCAIRVTGGKTEKWNETLRTSGSATTGNQADSGTLTDYKRGPAAPGNIDPTKAVGTWSIPANTGVLTYNYGDPSGPYSYTIRQITAGTTYEFCRVGTNELFNVTVSTSPTSNPTSCP